MLPEAIGLRFHEDAAFFREAVNFTAAQTGFAPRLIEKDYFCSVVLQYLAEAVPALVFKGGTCLAKVHVGFYRMSEDLDFVILHAGRRDARRAEPERRGPEESCLSRRDVAIRDFYDLDHAVRRLGLRLRDSQLLELLRQKLAVPGNDPVDASPARLAALTPQLDSRLKPVLRDQEFAEFDLKRAFTTVAEVAAALS